MAVFTRVFASFVVLSPFLFLFPGMSLAGLDSLLFDFSLNALPAENNDTGDVISLRKPGFKFKSYNLPMSAPQTFDNAGVVLFLGNSPYFELAPGGRPPGSYRGPGGGDVVLHQTSAGSNGPLYTWKRKDGIVFRLNRSGNWQLRYKKLLISGRRGSDRVRGIFPDGSHLRSYLTAKGYYLKYSLIKAEAISNYAIFKPGRWSPLLTKIGKFRFHHTRDWNDLLLAARRGALIRVYLRIARRKFGFKPPGEIPVLLFDTRKKAKAFYDVHNAKSNQAGVFRAHFLALCRECARAPRGDELYWKRTFIAGLTYNMRTNRCLLLRARRKVQDRVFDPPYWYSYGLATFLFHRAAPESQEKYFQDIKRLYLKADKIPAFDRLSANEYGALLLAPLFFAYIHDKYGVTGSARFNDALCLNPETAEVYKNTFQKDIHSDYQTAMEYYKTKRDI